MEINTKRLHLMAIFCFATALATMILFFVTYYTHTIILCGIMLWLSRTFRNEYWFNEIIERLEK